VEDFDAGKLWTYYYFVEFILDCIDKF